MRELVDLRKVRVLLVDNDHTASGPPASFPDETFQVRNEVVESEEVRRLAVNNVVLFAVGVLQKKSFIDAYKVGPVLQCDYEIKQREGQCIAVLLTAPCERALMSDKIVRMQFKTVRH